MSHLRLLESNEGNRESSSASLLEILDRGGTTTRQRDESSGEDQTLKLPVEDRVRQKERRRSVFKFSLLIQVELLSRHSSFDP